MSTVNPDSLGAWIRDVLEAAGSSADIAEVVARSLVSADLRGHSSHGVRLLPAYVERIATEPNGETNRIDPTARPRVEAQTGPRVLLDGEGAFGRVVGADATDLAIRDADEHGIGLVGVRDGNHLGRMGEWAELAAEEGMLFLAFVKAEAELVSPAGSATRRLSTNPIAAGVPTFDALEFPIVLDMATSVAAGGKVLERARTGRQLPERWVVDDDGDPMGDGTRFVDGEGALLPLGGTTAGHKGFGLAVISELFGAIVGDSVVAGEREHVPYNNSVALFAIDPTWFSSEQAIADRIRTFTAYIRDAEPVPEITGAAARDGVLLPGEAEHRAERATRRSGLELSVETLADLNQCADGLGVDAFDPA